MSEAISIGPVTNEFSGGSSWGRADDTALSTEAETLRKSENEDGEFIRRSIFIFGETAQALSEISLAAEEANFENWDGYGGKVVSSCTVKNAMRFICALPADIPMPEIAATSGGELSLDWCCDRFRTLALVVGDSRRLTYAWIDGSSIGNGTESFNGRKIPLRVVESIRQLLRHGHAAVRA